MEPQIKVIKELCLLVLSHSGLNVAEMLSLTMTGRVKLHSGEVRHITADLGGCLVEEQFPVSGNPETAAPAAPVQVSDLEDPAKQPTHAQHQNLGQEPQHDCSPAAGSNDPVPDNPAHAATQPTTAASVHGIDDGSPSATRPAAAAAVTAPVQPHTFKRKAVKMQLGGRDQTPCKKANREQQQDQCPAQLSAEDEYRGPVVAAVAAPMLAGNTGQDVSALASSEYGKADSQQTSSTTAEAVMSPAHAVHALPAVASVAEAAIMSAKDEQSSEQPQVSQHALEQHKLLNCVTGFTTTTPTTEAAAWPAAQATSATARQQTHNTAATYTYKCAFKTLLDTKPRSEGMPERHLCYIQTPNMTKFRFIKVATDAVCRTIEAECGRATCWSDVYQVLREHCTREMCQKLAQLHAKVAE